ncbi:hypothetical protein RHSIM_Rhsim12G0189700 [Rhododendron simsii]|uniref:Uncharacterized protein n=1 Tax=Rhododendron simsii TaxID=118357 RepID=A0A834L817_RHOSS|nr:hypothetical protein RHSIM_Rhsim12G0189700 [Rhododendron simsii]
MHLRGLKPNGTGYIKFSPAVGDLEYLIFGSQIHGLVIKMEMESDKCISALIDMCGKIWRLLGHCCQMGRIHPKNSSSNGSAVFAIAVNCQCLASIVLDCQVAGRYVDEREKRLLVKRSEVDEDAVLSNSQRSLGSEVGIQNLAVSMQN